VAGVATFNDIKIDTAGTKTLDATSLSLTAVTSNSFNITAPVTSRIRVETAPDGSGTLVQPQSLAAGSSLTVYAIGRTAGGVFVENVAADSWSIVDTTGDILAGDLVAAGDNKSAVMTGHGLGTCRIHAAKIGLVSLDSGTLTVIEGYTFVTKWGGPGGGDGQLSHPNGIAADGSGYIYVADSGNIRVQKFDANGNFVAKWGSLGQGDGQFNAPFGVAVDNCGHVYVTDVTRHLVQEFTSNGVFIAKWGGYGTGDGQFSYPRGIAIDRSGFVYVADQGNDRIQKFTPSGTFVSKWGIQGTGDGQFSDPEDVEIDGAGFVYVADNGNNRIQKYDATGVFLGWWGRDDLGNIGWHNPGSGRIGSLGIGNGQFAGPWALALDSIGNLFIADNANHRVQKFTPVGAFITKWGIHGSGDGQFDYTTGVVVDGSSCVYVSDWQNHRIQKFRRVETSYISVENAADGGIVLANQIVPAGGSITAYAISRSASGNYLGNVAADSWSLVNMCDGVVNGDLVPLGGGTSAVFTAHLAGSANIHVAKSGLTSVDSGLISVSTAGFTISGIVYYSTTRLSGVTVELYNSPPTSPLQTKTTDSNGLYTFLPVANGS